MTQLKIRQVRSAITRKNTQRQTLRTLGLKKIGDTTIRSQNPQVDGMIRAVTHLIDVEEVN